MMSRGLKTFTPFTEPRTMRSSTNSWTTCPWQSITLNSFYFWSSMLRWNLISSELLFHFLWFCRSCTVIWSLFIWKLQKKWNTSWVIFLKIKSCAGNILYWQQSFFFVLTHTIAVIIKLIIYQNKKSTLIPSINRITPVLNILREHHISSFWAHYGSFQSWLKNSCNSVITFFFKKDSIDVLYQLSSRY